MAQPVSHRESVGTYRPSSHICSRPRASRPKLSPSATRRTFGASPLELLEARHLLSAYFVSPSGSDANPGTEAAPWRTLQRAAEAVLPGDVVTARAGSYAGFHLTRDGTASSRVVFSAEPGAVVDRRNPATPDGINCASNGCLAEPAGRCCFFTCRNLRAALCIYSPP